ncbi:MAG: hypothetical protein HOM34_00645 [Planctomycetes bacterium]|jgi:tRNA pseudouridine synthase 10|nr:hypothetical protein [Planctomycetota bacterium]MBT4029267.1 hypothetical protein [Planctomycetota bacterium]MBT4560460.1 hypothetical protein [Planctomycetota bacterium]MBT5119212.1 hypothetical protein [Planctomycetota bacterium]MBT7318698.1 hypothetical protein [Planctomycetota bacterium]
MTENDPQTDAETTDRPIDSADGLPCVPQRILFEGRYRKLIRGVPQTVFHCPDCRGKGCDHCEGLGRLALDSVQDWIARVAMPRFKARRNKFHGAGREDIDVLMLGTGRPFVFEMSKCKRLDVNLEQLALDVAERSGGAVELVDLRYCEKAQVAVIKETLHAKTYQLKVDFPEGAPAAEEMAAKLDDLVAQGRFEITQRTPQRVAHRRADRNRVRWITVEKWAVDGEGIRVDLDSAHGTYIKEFVSGDEGRNEPNLADLLGAPARCVQLDVLRIHEN